MGPCSWKQELKSVQEQILKPVALTEFCCNVQEPAESIPSIPNFFESEIFRVMVESKLNGI